LAFAPIFPVKINVDYEGMLWVVDIWGDFHSYDEFGVGWLNQQNSGIDIKKGSDKVVWVMNEYGQVMRSN